jgi:hypothetical protein
MGNEGVIRFGEAQVRSAGTGIQHSENDVIQKRTGKNIAPMSIS